MATAPAVSRHGHAYDVCAFSHASTCTCLFCNEFRNRHSVARKPAVAAQQPVAAEHRLAALVDKPVVQADTAQVR